MNKKQYIDLTNEEMDLSNFKIERNKFEARLAEGKTQYDGFILAKSKEGKRMTVCDLNFHFSSRTGKYEARPTFKRTDKNYDVTNVKNGSIQQRISFDSTQEGYPAFWKMISFLEKYNEFIETGNLSTFQVVSTDDIIFTMKNKENEERLRTIQKILENTDIVDGDLLLISKRKKSLGIFDSLLHEDGYADFYREKNNIQAKGDEAIWHHFFKNNKWIFGLNLDYYFLKDFLDEQSIGSSDSKGRGNPKVDMIGLNDFTTLIELKTPNAKFFTDKPTKDARANTWSFSSSFIEAISQCLAQKDDFLKNINSLKLVDDSEYEVDKTLHKTIDPRLILVYGRKDVELPMSSKTDIVIKQKTLERCRRDSRNLTIISFDELYERAFQLLKT